MAVKIRLKRIGAKKQPSYRIVVADVRAPRDGRFIEEIGYYNPLTQPEDVRLDIEKADQWIKNGAQPTDTVRALIKRYKENHVENGAAEEAEVKTADQAVEAKEGE